MAHPATNYGQKEGRLSSVACLCEGAGPQYHLAFMVRFPLDTLFSYLFPSTPQTDLCKMFSTNRTYFLQPGLPGRLKLAK